MTSTTRLATASVRTESPASHRPHVKHGALRWLSALGLLVSLLAPAACSEDVTTTPGGGKSDIPGGDLDTIVLPDTGDPVDACDAWWCNLSDSGSDVEVPDADSETDKDIEVGPNTDDTDADPDSDAGQEETVDPKCEFAENPEPGEAGSPCKQPTDCNSGVCLETEDGGICTRPCADCCPNGFECTQLQGEVIFVCAPKTVRLCRPCIKNSDCVTAGDKSLCIGYGDSGRYCGAECEVDKDCPADYTCTETQGINNDKPEGQAKQCVRKSEAGICQCSVKAIELGASTVCSVTNGFGQCAGARSCVVGGLSECNAQTPLQESCNLKDDNCNGQTDEIGTDGVGPTGCTNYYLDVDNDGFGTQVDEAASRACLCKPSGLYTAASATDCNDKDGDIRPQAFEFCDDIDNDCDGQTDEGCDFDGDGYCDQKAQIKGEPKVCVNGINDCNDKNKNVAPGMKEQCGDGLDNDCNGQTDYEENAKGCVPYYFDGDGDLWGTGDAKCLCTQTGGFTAEKNGDCNDLDVQVNPNQIEKCGNFKDDNCNNKQDEDGALDCENFYIDKDTDSWGFGNPKCMCGPSLTHTASKTGDCADLDPTTNPTSAEQCGDAVDNDCDGKTDEPDSVGCTKLYADADNDTYGDDNNFKCLCGLDPNFPMYKSVKGGDCDDGKPLANPKGVETCDSVDNDCDGTTDEEGATNCTTWFADLDNDSFGDKLNSKCLCAPSAPYKAAIGTDCNDNNQQMYPSALEICDNIDNNCNSTIDEENASGCNVYFFDSDGDGYGLVSNVKCLCKANKPFSATQPGDCNDDNPTARPGLPEYCGDTFDNDCDGYVDETESTGCTNFYEDIDGDGFGNSLVSNCDCKPTGQLTALIGGDCDDTDVNVHPTLDEQCDDKDNDCNGIVDDPNSVGCTNYFIDVDLDTFGLTSQSSCLCKAKSPYTAAQGGDCNDADPKISPVQLESCNFKDDNCNGIIDADSPDATKYYVDQDGDGYGGFQSKNLCEPDGVYVSTDTGDCLDSDGFVYPGRPEVCNAKDDNCNGEVDEGGGSGLCPQVANSSSVCDKGCQTKCDVGWANANGQFADGCECAADDRYVQNIGKTCGGAQNLGAIPDTGGIKTVTGNILPGEAGDWFTFYAEDVPSDGCNTFHVLAKLVTNPNNQFALELYRGSCANNAQLCSGDTEMGWGVNFYGPQPYGPGALSNPAGLLGTSQPNGPGAHMTSPVPEKGGECKCTTAPGLPGQNICSDKSSVFKVRVYRPAGVADSCDTYQLEISNGLMPIQ
jgi:hypothetical protein